MERSLALRAKVLAKGTRRLPRLAEVPADDVIEADFVDDVIDADFVDVPNETALVVIAPARVSPGRARRVTEAYTTTPVDNGHVIAIA